MTANCSVTATLKKTGEPTGDHQGLVRPHGKAVPHVDLEQKNTEKTTNSEVVYGENDTTV